MDATVAQQQGDRGVILKSVLPAGRQDQHDCCGCNRQQRDHAGGLGPSGLGRPSDFVDQARSRTTSFVIVH
jgi:hypothetical protein